MVAAKRAAMSLAVSLAGFALAAAGTASAGTVRQVGDDYQLDYTRSRRTEIQVISPAGAAVEIFDGFRSVARGRAPFIYRAPSAAAYVVSLKTPRGQAWEAHVSARAQMRAILRARPGNGRTRVTLVRPVEALAMSDSDFAALSRSVRDTPMPQRWRAVTSSTASGRLTIQQAGELLDKLGAGRDRMRALGWLRDHLQDPDDAPALYGRLSLADRRLARNVLEP
jgi:hypothetical protein